MEQIPEFELEPSWIPYKRPRTDKYERSYLEMRNVSVIAPKYIVTDYLKEQQTISV